MKRILIVSLGFTLISSAIPVIGDEDQKASNQTAKAKAEVGEKREKNPYRELGISLVDALVAKDLVAYCSCWDTWRQLTTQIEKFRASGEELPDEKELEAELKDQRSYQRERNANIVYSYRVIMDAFKEKGVDVASLKLTSIKAHGRREEGPMIRVGGYDLVIASNKGAIEFDVDDGAFVDDRWYFTDSPTNISIKGEHYGLHTDEYSEKRRFTPDKK